MDQTGHLQHIIAMHFDPKWGAPYWCEVARSLNFDPRIEIKTPSDLPRLGPMKMDALVKRSVEDFVPRRFHGQWERFVVSETAGTTGPPKRTVFREDEFNAAFVAPFIEAAKLVRFPKARHWLFIGPSGPHVIGKAARACAKAWESLDPFMVDFDPRWSRKLPIDSLARDRYIAHILTQAEDVLRREHIGVLFATPPILEALGARLDEGIRRAVEGIHLGGVAAPKAFWERLTTDWFPNAVAMAGYGNSLAGMCPQVEWTPGVLPAYFPHGTRLLLDIVAPNDIGRGQVVFHRLDESVFLPNVLERDEAAIAQVPITIDAPGFQSTGILDPRPPQRATSDQLGLY